MEVSRPVRKADKIRRLEARVEILEAKIFGKSNLDP
jgi:hypothetical protein